MSIKIVFWVKILVSVIQDLMIVNLISMWVKVFYIIIHTFIYMYFKLKC